MTKKSSQTILSLCCILIISSTLLLTGCITENQDNQPSTFFSFEDQMNGWTSDGTDLDGPPVNWSITQSDHQAVDGTKSLKFYLDNVNDAGKIWIEKMFHLEENTTYTINLSYFFATEDFGDINLFRIITGASITDPETSDDLVYQDDTGHHMETQDLVWVEKSYTFHIQTDETGIVYIMIGVWGTWETERTYYIDAVNISVETLSTEDYPHLSGTWTIQYYDWMGNITKTENITITQTDATVHLKTANETLCSAIMYPNTLPAPHNISEYVIQDCDFRGLGIDYIYVYNETWMKTSMPLCENCLPAIFIKQT